MALFVLIYSWYVLAQACVWWYVEREISILIDLVTILGLLNLSIKCSGMPGIIHALRIVVPSPTGRRIFYLVLTLARKNMEDHSPVRKWKTPKHSLSILVLFLSLLGFHLSGHGYSLSNQLTEKQIMFFIIFSRICCRSNESYANYNFHWSSTVSASNSICS